MPTDAPSDRLESWKAIANYLGRSVRTARRWESEEGLPVHRHRHKSGGSVFAFRRELDAWRDSKAVGGTAAPAARPAPAEAAAVAVLPFGYLGPDSSRAYIADGFTEEVITALSRVPELRVISWTSSMTLKGNTKGARDIGRSLGVGRLVEGSVRHEGDRLRISARLVDAETDSQVWSERFEGRLDDLFDIEDRMAAAVVAVLDIGVDPVPTAQPAPPDIAAWQFLVQARQAALRWHKASIDEAVALLEAGLERAPNEPRLHAALGMAYVHYREAGIDLGEAPIRAAEACARRLEALAPDLAAGHQLAGWIHYGRAQIDEAVHALRAAHAQEPWDPDTLSLLGNCLLISGRVSAARPLIDVLCRIDPLTPLTRCMPGWADALEGKFESAIGPYRKMFEADPQNPFGRLFLVYMLAAAGQAAEAHELALCTPVPVLATPPGQVLQLCASALGGERPKPLPSELAVVMTRASDVLPRMIGQAYAIAGDVAQAVHWIGVAVDRGFINFPFLSEHDPFLSALAGDPAWDALLEDVRKRWETFPD